MWKLIKILSVEYWHWIENYPMPFIISFMLPQVVIVLINNKMSNFFICSLFGLIVVIVSQFTKRR